MAVAAEAVAAAEHLTELELFARQVAGCTKCRLAQGRTQVVFGVGDPHADLMFVGEAPGFHEDKQGIPFVGQAGKLLYKLLAGRLDHGDLRLEREPVDLAGLVRTAVETMREQLPESVTLRIVPDGAVKAVGDPDRIEQVLLNLIDNAVKYSPRGGEVTVATLPAEGRARVEVADEGLGIPPAEHGSVFEKFYRGRSVQVPTGTGLGLYICRELVRRMGGTIGVRSRPGAGSTFYFELPSDT